MKKRLLSILMVCLMLITSLTTGITAHAQDPVEAFVERLYECVLGRGSDSKGLSEWTQQLKNQANTGADVAYGFVFSQEFKDRNLSDEAYVKVLYRTFLDREADAEGLAGWIAVLDSGLSRMHVFKGFVESPEFTGICQDYGIIRGNVNLTAPMDQNEGITRFVARCYQLCLGRKGDEAGMNSWCSQLLTSTNTPKQVAYGFVFSNEFRAKNLSDTDYIKTLYRVFMNREADAEGLASWINVLAGGASREHVFSGFADSPEFTQLYQDMLNGVDTGNSGQSSVHTHDFKVVSETSATCTSDGVRTYQCSCGETKTEVIAAALGHNWVKKTHTETIPAQTHTEAEKKYVCNGCGAQFDTVDEVGRHVVADFWDNCENYTYKAVSFHTVIDVPESTVEVTDYIYCSRCGVRQ